MAELPVVCMCPDHYALFDPDSEILLRCDVFSHNHAEHTISFKFQSSQPEAVRSFQTVCSHATPERAQLAVGCQLSKAKFGCPLFVALPFKQTACTALSSPLES